MSTSYASIKFVMLDPASWGALCPRLAISSIRQ